MKLSKAVSGKFLPHIAKDLLALAVVKAKLHITLHIGAGIPHFIEHFLRAFILRVLVAGILQHREHSGF